MDDGFFSGVGPEAAWTEFEIFEVLSWLESAHSSLPTSTGNHLPLFPYPEAWESPGEAVDGSPLEMTWAKRHVNVGGCGLV